MSMLTLLFVTSLARAGDIFPNMPADFLCNMNPNGRTFSDVVPNLFRPTGEGTAGRRSTMDSIILDQILPEVSAACAAESDAGAVAGRLQRACEGGCASAGRGREFCLADCRTGRAALQGMIVGGWLVETRR